MVIISLDMSSPRVEILFLRKKMFLRAHTILYKGNANVCGQKEEGRMHGFGASDYIDGFTATRS